MSTPNQKIKEVVAVLRGMLQILSERRKRTVRKYKARKAAKEAK